MTLHLRNIAALEVFLYLLHLTHTQYEITPEAVLIVSTVTDCSSMEAGDYQVPFEAMTRLVKKAGVAADGLAGADVLESPALLRECLEKLGIPFFTGSSVSYHPSTERLLIRTSGNALELLEVILNESSPDQPSEQRHREKQFRRILKARHQLSEKRLIKVEARAATMQEVINGISEKLYLRLLFVQSDGATLQAPMPGQAPETTPASSGPRFNLAMKDVTVLELLQELARQTGTELIIGTRAVVLLAPSPSP